MAIPTTAIVRVRTGGSNNNGGGFDPVLGAGNTDYSQQDAAQLSLADAIWAGGATFTTVAGGLTAIMVGNAGRLTGGVGLTVGCYYLTQYIDGNTGVVDRSPGTGTATAFNIGGAWADPWTNLTSTNNLRAGNTVYVRGNNSGSPSDNPTNVDYTATTFFVPISGTVADGWLRIIGENGRPFLSSNQPCIYLNSVMVYVENIKFRATGTTLADYGFVHPNATSGSAIVVNCSADQNNNDVVCFSGNQAQGSMVCIGVEAYSNTGSGGTKYALLGALTNGQVSQFIGCNVHDCKGGGISIGDSAVVLGNIVAKNNGIGILIDADLAAFVNLVMYNTIDANTDHQVSFADAASLARVQLISNLITNAPTGKYGINVAAGTTAANNLIKGAIDFNWLYNPVDSPDKDYNAVSGGPHDTVGSDPLYTDQSTQDYTLQSTSPAIGKGFPAAAAPSLPIGASPAYLATIQQYFLRRSATPNVENEMDAGAVQRVMAGISNKPSADRILAGW